MRPYVYEPLNLSSSTFRLVRLVQGEGPHIECDLFHAALYDTEDAVEYEALSYTWGGGDQPHNIEIEGAALGVTRSLFEALQYLRHGDEDRILWIDAICIDQDDHKERGHQVQQMAAIYENARQVVIWLGSSTLETDLLFSYMQQLERQAFNHACNEWAPTDTRWRFLWSNVTMSMEKLNDVDTMWQRHCFHRLLTRPWFQRVWVLQEVAKARRAKVMCGDKTVSSRVFAVMPTLLGAKLDQHTQAVLEIMPGPSRKHSWWVQRRDLQTLLHKFREAEASDPRDNIYALLGISSDAHDTEALRPDYSKSSREVVRSTIAFVLGVVGDDRMMRHLPSWAWQELRLYLNAFHERVFAEAWKDGQQQFAEFICDRGIDSIRPSWSDHKDFYERTLLAWAAENNSETILGKLLASQNVNIKTGDWLGRTPLHFAVENGHEGAVRMLLEHDITPDARDWCGKTPLSWAAGQGRVTIVELLLDTGAFDLNTFDKSGWTPLALAEANEHHEVIALLKEAVPGQDGRYRLHPEWRRHTAPLRVETRQVELVDQG